MSEIEYRNVLTTCPYCGCGCGLYLQMMNGEIVGVLPSKTHPISQGALCIKGWNAHAFIYSKDRLKKPLIKKNDKLVETSWEEAISTTAIKLLEIRDKHGADSIGIFSSARCTNEENYVIAKFARAVIGTNNIDHCARLCHASTVVGLGEVFGSGAMTNSVGDMEKADCILITGSNTLEQHPLIGARIMRAKDRGARLIIVDPREVIMAKFADIYLQPKPGTDVAWLNGFINIILAENLEDERFIKERTEGFEDMQKVVEKYSPKYVENITDIPKERLIAAAKMFASAERGCIVYSMGITQHTTGVDNVKSIANLAMVTGNIGLEGTGVNPLRGQNNVQGACDMGCLPNVFSGYQKVSDENVIRKFEEAWRTSMPRNLGLTVSEMIYAAAERKIKFLYIVGENIMVSDPNLNHVQAALKKLEFLAVQDIFLTETAALADVVLPSASFAEKDGTFTATDRCVQMVRKAIPAIGDTKPDWAIICLLAKKIGANGFEYSSAEEIFREISSLTPSYAGISYERLNKELRIPWPCPSQDHPGTPILHKDKFTRGKGKFSAVEYKPPAELPDEDYPLILTTGRVIFHYHTGTMTRRSAKLDSEMKTGYVEISPTDARNLGIKDKEQVIAKSRRGEIKIQARVSKGIKDGVVFIPFHFAECAANLLTIDAVDPIAKIPELKVCAVRIEKQESPALKGGDKFPLR